MNTQVSKEKEKKKEKQIHCPSFIGTYNNALPDEACDQIKKFADNQIKSDPVGTVSPPHGYGTANYRKEWFTFTHDTEYSGVVNFALADSLEKYTDEYFGLFYNTRFISITQKLQVTPPTGGFHGWHCEHGYNAAERVLAWMIYLNDLPEGEGETEFLHQRCRLKPTKGQCVIFPSSFTHTHRGNPPLTTTKYILTGWYVIAQNFGNEQI